MRSAESRIRLLLLALLLSPLLAVLAPKQPAPVQSFTPAPLAGKYTWSND